MTDPQTSALIGAILSLGTPEECKAFLTDLCTVKEIDEFSARLEVARLLSSGVNYHDIVERTGASTATISRVSKALSGSSGGYRTALSRLGMPRVRDGVPTDKLPLLPTERAAYSLMAHFEERGYHRYARSTFPEGAEKETFGDVTLSLIDTVPTAPGTYKYCYFENLLRPDEKRRLLRRISQTGIECIGNVTGEEEKEVLALAAVALSLLAGKFEISVAPLAYSDALFARYGIYGTYRREAYRLLRTSPAELRDFLLTKGEEKKSADAVADLLCVKRKADEGLSEMRFFAASDAERAACEELRTALSGITSGNLTIDFTLTPGMEYYDDLFFVGRTGRTTEVLRGGRYDALVHRHGHDGGAVGFAVYLDALTKK